MSGSRDNLHKMVCCWGKRKSSRDPSRKNDVNPRTVKDYLNHHPGVLIDVMRNLVSSKPYRRSSMGSPNNSDIKLLGLNDPTRIKSIELHSKFFLKQTDQQSIPNHIFNSARILAASLHADWFALYLPCTSNSELEEYVEGGDTRPYGPIAIKTTVSAEAAVHRSIIHVKDLPRELRTYPKGVGRPERDVHRVLSIPLCLPSGDFLGVVEFCRSGETKPFNEHELQLSDTFFDWMVTSMYQAKIIKLLDHQTKLNNFLLDNSKKVLDDKMGFEDLVETILRSIKELVDADRCTMFLVDEENRQLYAHYFDEGFTENGKCLFSKKQNIRFSCDKGIAGYVYRTGETVNVMNAYSDGRFNPEVDKETGYHTTSILCMPVECKSRVVGVLQLINSLSNDHFTPSDGDAFDTYAVYCALALHCSRLTDLLKISEARCKVCMEVLRFHMVSSEEEAMTLVKSVPVKKLPDSFSQFSFVAYEHENVLPQLFIYMVHDLFGKHKLHLKTLCRFVLTVKKNYRSVPFHNWLHAIHTVHTLYCILKGNKKTFNTVEMMALVIAGLCHDIQHEGFNNEYYEEFHHPLAKLYSSSIIQNSHYKHTVTILEMDDHDICSFLSKNDYKLLLKEICQNTIATDVSNFYANHRVMSKMLKSKSFDIRKDDCRKCFKGLVMLGADLSSVTKDWDVHYATVDNIYEEFYKQGDEERRHGLQVTAMMDRHFRHEMPKQQVHFLKCICMPLYTTLQQVFSNTDPLLNKVMKNLQEWKQLASKSKQPKEKKR
ncbi:cAMP and cAMP-inhibited cGMP 3',5'-cyclic phosphodiesterase 10A-like [Gigantopelta aegis]|uniref:cAMP and cAMP-inhibited cGMP 3',5'-cyclic phosphodiesterase 10A-like n=1 Tax=Gigantopelta aegis TaxID=1735272 RepID=UPI001B88793B|nr:cAMP and cAMP-inhibited cGMP 3',5'-cyclic phosphodiesterase 10A-like [Gigantopelta aegis]